MKRILTIIMMIVIFLNTLNSYALAGEFYWPIEKPRVGNNPIKWRLLSGSKGWHVGWDINASKENDNPYIYAIADGTVITVTEGVGGNQSMIKIEHELEQPIVLKNIKLRYLYSKESESYSDGGVISEHNFGNKLYSNYIHLASETILVKVGNKVKAGMPIAVIGSTGCSSEYHLHFSIGSKATPEKDEANAKKELLFSAEGQDVKLYLNNDDSDHKDFQNTLSSPNCLTNDRNFTYYVFSPSYIFGTYTYVDIPQEDCINTIEEANKLLKNQVGYDNDRKEENTWKKNGGTNTAYSYIGIRAAVSHYGPNWLKEHSDFIPTKLTNTFDGKKIASSGNMLVGGTYINTSTLIELASGDNELEIGGRISNYGSTTSELSGLINLIADSAGMVIAIAMYIGIVSCGIGLILQRKNAEERANVIGALLTVGIASIMLSVTGTILSFIDSFIG